MTADAELMPIPLWHGTSSWFLPGILEHGLGAIDVHAQLRSREFFRDAWDIMLQVAPPDECEDTSPPHWIPVNHVLNNGVTQGGFNYRYGTRYCTGDQRKAVSYATGGFGSELVEFCSRLLTRLRELRPELATNLLSAYPEMAECFNHNHRPIVIRMDGIERRHVLEETGEPFTADFDDDLLPFISFELTQLPNRSQMTIFHIEPAEEGALIEESYKLVPLQDPGV